jgi:hypothetical protein
MMTIHKVKSSILVSEPDRRALIMRLIVTLGLLAAVLKIGS